LKSCTQKKQKIRKNASRFFDCCREDVNAVPQLHVTENGQQRMLDLDQVRDLINVACQGLDIWLGAPLDIARDQHAARYRTVEESERLYR
jgi:hypothetical protein